MDLVSFLSSRFRELTKPSLSELQEILCQIPNLSERTEPYVTEPSEYPYGRNVIYRNEEIEVIVVNLPAHSRTYIHDHGESVGCGRIAEGVLTNASFEAVHASYAHKTAESRVPAGDLFVTPAGTIHQMLNDTDNRVVSVHVYSPPLQGLKRYEEQPVKYVFLS